MNSIDASSPCHFQFLKVYGLFTVHFENFYSVHFQFFKVSTFNFLKWSVFPLRICCSTRTCSWAYHMNELSRVCFPNRASRVPSAHIVHSSM
jgi:hypothetical protein